MQQEKKLQSTNNLKILGPWNSKLFLKDWLVSIMTLYRSDCWVESHFAPASPQTWPLKRLVTISILHRSWWHGFCWKILSARGIFSFIYYSGSLIFHKEMINYDCRYPDLNMSQHSWPYSNSGALQSFLSPCCVSSPRAKSSASKLLLGGSEFSTYHW